MVDLLTITTSTGIGGAGGWLLARWRFPDRSSELLEKIRHLETRVAAQQELIEQLQRQWQDSITSEAAAHRRIETLRGQLDEAMSRIAELEGSAGSGRILGIWPDTPDHPLDLRTDADAIYNSAIPYDALTGPVHRAQIVSHLRRGRYSILELGGHGRANAVQLGDGWALEGWWRRVLTRYPVELAILLTCHSETLAHAFIESGCRAVVAVAGAIRDQDAGQFAQALHEYLAAGDALGDAVELAKLSIDHREGEKIVTVGDTQWRMDPAG